MAVSKRNVLVGAARLFIGPSGTNRPAFEAATAGPPAVSGRYTDTMNAADGSTTGDGTAVTDWREIGYTTDGVEVATDPTYDEITVDQTMDAVRMFKSANTASVSTTMAEATLENLIVAWGQPRDTLDDVTDAANPVLYMEAGGLGDAPTERGLIIIGNAPEVEATGQFGERVYHLYRAVSVEGSTYNMSRTDASTIPVTFRTLPDDVTGRYGSITDKAEPVVT